MKPSSEVVIVAFTFVMSSSSLMPSTRRRQPDPKIIAAGPPNVRARAGRDISAGILGSMQSRRTDSTRGDSSSFAARRASAADLDVVTGIITHAFENDPLWSRAMALPSEGVDHHAAFWRLYVAGALRYPWRWIANDGEAASIWIPPGGS